MANLQELGIPVPESHPWHHVAGAYGFKHEGSFATGGFPNPAGEDKPELNGYAHTYRKGKQTLDLFSVRGQPEAIHNQGNKATVRDVLVGPNVIRSKEELDRHLTNTTDKRFLAKSGIKPTAMVIRKAPKKQSDPDFLHQMGIKEDKDNRTMVNLQELGTPPPESHPWHELATAHGFKHRNSRKTSGILEKEPEGSEPENFSLTGYVHNYSKGKQALGLQMAKGQPRATHFSYTKALTDRLPGDVDISGLITNKDHLERRLTNFSDKKFLNKSGIKPTAMAIRKAPKKQSDPDFLHQMGIKENLSMAASTKLVEAITQQNPLLVAETFKEAMSQLCMGHLLTLREQAAANLFRENIEPDFESAIDFTLTRLEYKGPSVLAETVKIASENYNVDQSDILEYLKEAFDQPEPYESLAEDLVLGMVNMLADGHEGVIVEFANNTARILTKDENAAMLNLWESLDAENRQIMEREMISNVNGFERVLAFAEEYVEEGWPESGPQHFDLDNGLQKYGFSHQGKNSEGHDVFQHPTGNIVTVDRKGGWRHSTGKGPTFGTSPGQILSGNGSHELFNHLQRNFGHNEEYTEPLQEANVKFHTDLNNAVASRHQLSNSGWDCSPIKSNGPKDHRFTYEPKKPNPKASVPIPMPRTGE